jgi:hypothetical protein
MLLRKWGQKLLTMSLLAGMFSYLANPVKAQERFDNYNISFNQDTIVEFEFIRSNGSNQSTFGVINLTTGEKTVFFQEVKPYDAYDNYVGARRNPRQRNIYQSTDNHLGTMGNSVLPGTNITIVPHQNRANGSVIEFLFRKDQVYAFFLESINVYGQSRSTLLSSQNYVQFDGDLGGGMVSDRYGRNILGQSIKWEDGGERYMTDNDFDDFIVEAGGIFRDSSCHCQPYYNNNYSYYYYYYY